MATKMMPFLKLNLGSEMIFVIAQRLEAQNIESDKAALVLDDIITALLEEKTTNELFQDQTPYTHLAMRQLLENIVHSSIMQLDKHSMDRLWDLVTMIYKWQTTMSTNIIHVTRKHLSELSTLCQNPSTLLILQKVQIQFENYIQQLNDDDLIKIHQKLLLWLDVFQVRVSILLKLGLQNQDGSFVCDNFNEASAALLRNLGTNIYAVEKKLHTTSINNNEITQFASQVLGEKKINHSYVNLNITKSICNDARNNDKDDIVKPENKMFSNINCCNSNKHLQGIFFEMSNDNDKQNTKFNQNLKDDLLNLLSDNTLTNK